jgi:N-acetylmuramoyl-L-alanine amidase
MMRVGGLVLLAFLFLSPVSHAEPVAVHNLRLWPAPDNTRLVFDLSGPVEHKLSLVHDPERIVVDIPDARLQDGLAPLDVARTHIAAVRAAEAGDGGLRITLDLRRPTRAHSFVLRPYGQYGHRLVIDLFDEAAVEATPEPEPRAAPPAKQVLRPRDLVVAIDAGHGGEDPGAIGRRWRTREKDVTLAIARELARLVNATPGMKGVLIRDGDYFVELVRRREKARRLKADVFVSIHADSLPGKRANQVRGSSVYALSDRGASSALARALADDANASDWIGGIDPRELDRDVRGLIGDLTKDAAMADGSRLGADVLSGLRGAGPLHNERVAHAGFAVLKQPWPAVLVETAFISNAREEELLRSPAHRRRIAEGIHGGLKRAAPWIIARRESDGGTAVVNAPAPTAPAAPAPMAGGADGAREHVVKAGETLSAFARLYDIHVDALRFLNDIHDNDLPVGLKLRIPARGGDG